MNQEYLKRSKGITLIALVVTIIVLIILAGISINLILGENGIIKKAQEAKTANHNAQEKEMLQLAIVAANNYETGKIEEDKLRTELTNYTGGADKYTLTKSGNVYTVTFNDCGKSYFINDGGNVDMAGENSMISGKEFNETIPAAATSIVFTDIMPPEGAELTDLSKNGDNGVVGWYDETSKTYYVSSQIEGVEIFADSDLSYMFTGKTNLTSIDLSNLNTELATDMTYMFGSESGAMKLSSITFGDNFDTSNVNSFLGMFRNCRSITEIDVTGFDTSSATTMERMFDQCRVLETVDCSGFDTSKVTSMYCMFQVNYKLESVGDISGWDLSNCTNTRNLFNYCQKLGNVDVSDWDVSKVVDMKQMFAWCDSFTELDVSNWDVSSCENLAYVFSGCKNITTLDVSGWDVSSAKSLLCIFQQMESVKELDVSNWDVSNVENFGFVFYGCTSLTTVPIENWDVSNATTFDHTFAHCDKLVVDVSKWDVTNKVRRFNAMFHSNAATYMDVSNFDTSGAVSMYSMFEAMPNLVKIDGLENFNTSNCVAFEEMFSGDCLLKELNLSSWDTRKANQGTVVRDDEDYLSQCTKGIFANCSSLEKITLGEYFTFEGDGTASSTYYGVLPTPSSGYWYAESDGTAYLPADVPNLKADTYYSEQQS